jgi:hypothetical protein
MANNHQHLKCRQLSAYGFYYFSHPAQPFDPLAFCLSCRYTLVHIKKLTSINLGMKIA